MRQVSRATNADLEISRRTTLKIGAGGLVAAVLGEAVALDARAAGGGLATLSPTEGAGVTAIAERIWPGAHECGVLTYIDRALAGAYGKDLGRYHEALRLIDAAAERRFGRTFAGARPADQDAVLGDLEANKLEGFPAPKGREAFNLLRRHVMEGVFCDPIYGGNRDFAGWKAVGYPGPYRLYTEADQVSNRRLDMPYQGIQDI